MEELRKSFKYFAAACRRLANTYITIRELRLDNQSETIPLMNRVAPRFFAELLDTYEDALFLGMARLSERAATKIAGQKEPNLSIARICELLSKEGLLSAEISALQDQLKIGNYSNIKRLRDKHIAHLNATVIEMEEKIDVPSWSEIREYFVRLEAFVAEASRSIDPDNPVLLLAGRSNHVPRLLRHLERITVDETELTQDLFRENFGHYKI